MIRRMILAAAVGLLAAGVASAQQPMPAIPLAYAPQTAAPAAQAQPAPLTGAPGAVPAVAAPIAVPAQPGCCGSAPAAGGCDSCGQGGKHHGRLASSPWTIGAGCANPIGCSTCASERTFLFGSCNQFFNPGNKCGGLCSGGGLFGRCATGPQGTGIPGVGPCGYGSYMNR
jgi:hypothetical protein